MTVKKKKFVKLLWTVRPSQHKTMIDGVKMLNKNKKKRQLYIFVLLLD